MENGLIVVGESGWQAVGAIGTWILAVFAMVAAYIAWKNIKVLREQNRRNTFLTLLAELGKKDTRADREMVYLHLEDIKLRNYNHINKVIESGHISGREDPNRRRQEAFESTIACLDRVGFFLQHGGDKDLKKEAPHWLWDIATDMWDRLGEYVIHKQQTTPNYGKYFKEMVDEFRNK